MASPLESPQNANGEAVSHGRPADPPPTPTTGRVDDLHAELAGRGLAVGFVAGFLTANGSRDTSLVERRIQQLVRFEQLGRKTRRIGVRELPIEGTPYVVVNRRLDDEILILRIFHNGAATAN